MNKPQLYESQRELRLNRQVLRETAKDYQLSQGVVVSEDLLIRSLKEAQTNLLPYMREMRIGDKHPEMQAGLQLA